MLLPLAAVGVLFSVLPASWQRLLGALVGAALRGAGFRRSIVARNLERAYPGDGEGASARRHEIERGFYAHAGHLFLTLLTFFGGWRRFATRYGRLEGKEHWVKAKAQGRGVIFVASHLGNWELMAATGAMAGIPILLVTKRLKPAWLHRAVERGRLTCGVRATYEPRTLRDVLSTLSSGESVGFVLDQYAGPPVGVRVPFFGVPVGTHSAPAMLALRTRAPVLPVSGAWEQADRFVVRIGPELPWVADQESPTQAVALNTEAYSREVERRIREHPEQWLWTHQRFKGELGPITPEEREDPRVRTGAPRSNPER